VFLDIETSGGYDDELIARLLALGHCKEKEMAVKTVETKISLLLWAVVVCNINNAIKLICKCKKSPDRKLLEIYIRNRKHDAEAELTKHNHT
jgi:hypothetical protein